MHLPRTSADECGHEPSPAVRLPPVSPISIVEDLYRKPEVPGDTAITLPVYVTMADRQGCAVEVTRIF